MDVTFKAVSQRYLHNNLWSYIGPINILKIGTTTGKLPLCAK